MRLISTALNKALQELHAIPDTPQSTVATSPNLKSSTTGSSPRSTSSLIVPVLAPTAPVPLSATAFPTNMEVRKHTSSQIGHGQSTHPFTGKLAVGPPSDLLVKANENFAVHKQFRDQNSLLVPEPSLHPD